VFELFLAVVLLNVVGMIFVKKGKEFEYAWTKSTKTHMWDAAINFGFLAKEDRQIDVAGSLHPTYFVFDLTLWAVDFRIMVDRISLEVFKAQPGPYIHTCECREKLVEAISKLYYAAIWHADRPVVDEAKLWKDVRDAAGFPEGQSPKPLV